MATDDKSEQADEIPYEQAALSPMARSFYADSRRICNARIKQELGVVLRYPSYREGLASLLASASAARHEDQPCP